MPDAEERVQPPQAHAEAQALLKKGPWTPEEDAALLVHVSVHGACNWHSVRRHTGISRSGKSCRLRWYNNLRPKLPGGPLQLHEADLIIDQHALLGNQWSCIAAMVSRIWKSHAYALNALIKQ